MTTEVGERESGERDGERRRAEAWREGTIDAMLRFGRH